MDGNHIPNIVIKILIIILLSAVFLSGCSVKTVTSDTNQEDKIEFVTNEAGEFAAAPAETDYSKNEAVAAEAAGTSDLARDNSDYCYVHSHSYHGVPGEFIDYVGQEAFNQYRETRTFFNVEKGETCTSTYTFPDFLSYFNITKEEFCKIYNNSPCWYSAIHDADILYSGDARKNRSILSEY